MKRILLGDIASIASGGTPSRSNPDFWGGDIPWVKTGEVQFNRIKDTEERITHAGVDGSATKIFPKNTLLMAMYGQGKTRGQVAILEIDAAINQACAAITLNSPGDTTYLYHYLAFNYQNIRKLSNSGSQENLSADLIRSIPIHYPSQEERSKIADILSTWDEALEKLDALIATKERRKQALTRQLLARSSAQSEVAHARHRLGEVCERVTRRNRVTSGNVLTISAQEGLVSQSDYFNRSVAGADLGNYYLLHRGEFAYNRSSAKGYPYGAIKRLDRYDEGVVSTLYLCFRIRPKAAVSSAYLCHYFEAGLLNHGLRTVAKEGARAHGLLNVTSEDFFDLDIFLPTLREQKKFAEILDTADQELALLRRHRDALHQQKCGLMQQLLTGKLRVTPKAE